jgi:hypothetical protein
MALIILKSILKYCRNFWIFFILFRHAPLQLGNNIYFFIQCYLSWRCHTFNTLCKSVWIHGVYCRWSKSIDSTKVRNESRCFVIRSCLLAGQCPAVVTFLFIACLFASSRGQWYRRWSIVWSPCSQTHVTFSRILNRWKYALAFPCPVILYKYTYICIYIYV